MQSTPLRDFVVGLFVLVGLGALGGLSLAVGGASYAGRGGFALSAVFSEVGGLSARAPVTIAGVRVGQVRAIELDADLNARVLLDVREGLLLPVDTAAAIRTAGLLGDQFVALEPGAEDELLVAGDTIAFTENALSLEKLLGTLVHGASLGD